MVEGPPILSMILISIGQGKIKDKKNKLKAKLIIPIQLDKINVADNFQPFLIYSITGNKWQEAVPSH